MSALRYRDIAIAMPCHATPPCTWCELHYCGERRARGMVRIAGSVSGDALCLFIVDIARLFQSARLVVTLTPEFSKPRSSAFVACDHVAREGLLSFRNYIQLIRIASPSESHRVQAHHLRRVQDRQTGRLNRHLHSPSNTVQSNRLDPSTHPAPTCSAAASPHSETAGHVSFDRHIAAVNLPAESAPCPSPTHQQ